MNPIDALDKVWAAASKLKELSDKIKEADIRMAIAELMMNVADLKVQIAALKEDNLGLKKKLEVQGDWDKTKTNLRFERGMCFLKQDDNESGPFCGRCAEVERKLISLADMPAQMRNMVKYSCPNCKAHFS